MSLPASTRSSTTVRRVRAVANRWKRRWRDRRSWRLDRSGHAWARAIDHWSKFAPAFLRLGHATEGNAVRIFHDGDSMLESLWTDIAAAKRRVWVETYIMLKDRVGQRTIDELTAAAARGCEVVLLIDHFGCLGLPSEALQPLRLAGGRVEIFNCPWRWIRKLPLLRRDHRKIAVIDEAISYCGGMNLSEDYAGSRHGNGRFVDTHLRMEGPGTRDLAKVLASSLEKPRPLLPHLSKKAGGCVVQVLASAGRADRDPLQRSIKLALRLATHEVNVCNSYFVPPRWLRRALIKAAQRGVKVRVLTAGISDVPMVRLASWHIADRLITQKVHLHELHRGTLHAKTIAVDHLLAVVGSFNLDYWSDRRNLEVNVTMFDPEAAANLDQRFEQLLADSREITMESLGKRTWWRRVKCWAAYQLMKL